MEDLPRNPDDPVGSRRVVEVDDDFATILRAQASQVQTIFTAQLRADEGRFRKKQQDNLGKLLTILATEERKLITVMN